MDGSAVRGDDDDDPVPGMDSRQALMIAAEICGAVAAGLALRGPHGAHMAMMLRQAADAVRDLGPRARFLVFNEAVAEAERARGADEALAAAGLVPPPRGRHLHVVS